MFWAGLKGTNLGDELAVIWSKVIDCISAPFPCGVLISAEPKEFADTNLMVRDQSDNSVVKILSV